MQLFYCPQILDGEHFLKDEEARHCTKVLRKKSSDIIDITDGQGSFYEAKLTDLTPSKCNFEIIKSTFFQKYNPTIHIAIAPTKNIDRTEWFVEKAIEIGVDEISFLMSAHSERNKINVDRIRKKAISAIKQSIRPWLPQINGIQKVSNFIKSIEEEQKFVAHLDENPTPYLHQKAKDANSYLVLIGPEGGFSNHEISMMHEHEFLSVRLGNHRLRTETAGVMACALLNTIKLQ